jgi:hypothetical protein
MSCSPSLLLLFSSPLTATCLSIPSFWSASFNLLPRPLLWSLNKLINPRPWLRFSLRCCIHQLYPCLLYVYHMFTIPTPLLASAHCLSLSPHIAISFRLLRSFLPTLFLFPT